MFWTKNKKKCIAFQTPVLQYLTIKESYRFSFLSYSYGTNCLVTGAEKERSPTGTRTQGLSLTVRLPLSYRATRRPVTFSPCLIRFVPEYARNHANRRDSLFHDAARSQSTFTKSDNLCYCQSIITTIN